MIQIWDGNMSEKSQTCCICTLPGLLFVEMGNSLILSFFVWIFRVVECLFVADTHVKGLNCKKWTSRLDPTRLDAKVVIGHRQFIGNHNAENPTNWGCRVTLESRFGPEIEDEWAVVSRRMIHVWSGFASFSYCLEWNWWAGVQIWCW